MGVSAITLNNFSTRRTELTNRVTAVNNTYSAGNKYRHQELYLTDAVDNNVSVSSSLNILWDSKKESYQMIAGQGGGSSYLLMTDSSNQWYNVKTVNNHSKMTGPGVSWIYSKKFDKYYSIGAGLGEYDNTFTPTSRGYQFAGGSNSLTYDFKRDYIVTAGVRFDGVSGNWITQIDPAGEETNQPPFGLQMARNYLYETSANKIKFLSYSSYDDMYYYSDENKIIKVNPVTGVGSVIITKGTDILGLMIEKDSQRGYYAYVDGDDVKLARFDLLAPSNTYTEVNLGNIDRFVFLYVGKTIVVNCAVDSFNTGAWYTVSYNVDLTLNLTYEKYLFHVSTGITTAKSSPKHSEIQSSVSSKYYKLNNIVQEFKPLSNDEVNIHIPVYIGGVSGPYKTTTNVLNVNPVTAYPVITDPTATDCCLDELKCEINIKLAKKSCEATNREIVGRHYGCMFDDAQLLEALLWITTFDCLTCDEIENLRCITSKI